LEDVIHKGEHPPGGKRFSKRPNSPWIELTGTKREMTTRKTNSSQQGKHQRDSESNMQRAPSHNGGFRAIEILRVDWER